jgi:hypothetical protein
MKIIAQSEVPPKVPYIHLGYLAATSRGINAGLLGTGLAIVILGIFAARKYHVVWSGDLEANIDKKLLGRTASFLAVMIGLLLLLLSLFMGPVTRPHAGTITRLNMKHIDFTMEVYLKDVSSDHSNQPALNPGSYLGTNISNGLRYWPDFPKDNSRALTDGWDHAMSFDFFPSSNHWNIRITSAGADGQFGTQDDISQTNVFPKSVQ